MTPYGTARVADARDARPRPGRRPRRVTLAIAGLGDGGAERVVSLLAKHWASTYQVSVVTVGSVERDVYQLPPGVERLALGLLEPSRHPIEASWRSGKRILALRRALDRLQPDVVVSFMTPTNVLCLLAAAGRDVAVLVAERSDPRREGLGLPWVGLRRVLYPRAAGVIVQTESVAGWARRFCARVHVIPNFVEPPARLASPAADVERKQLLAVGRLSPEKGFDLLISAFARVCPRQPDWSLTIVGEGAERRRLEALVESLGLRSRVDLPGRTSDTAARLADAHAFALPSRYEGFPNALLEAMASGLPVVAFDCPSGPADIITHETNGLLVSEGDVGQFAAALERVMESPSERARLGGNARRVVDTLGPEPVLARWSTLLEPAGEGRR